MIYFSIFCGLFAFTFGQDGCMAPANMVGLLVHNSTQNSKFDEPHTAVPPAMCHCQDAKQLFWHSSTEEIPDGAFNSSQVALLLDTARGCKNLCFCAENGTCFTSQVEKQTYLELIPYCENGECHMYAAVFNEVYESFSYDLMQSENGTLYRSPNPYQNPVGTNSSYITVASVGCSGCADLKSISLSTCTAGPAE